MPSHTSLRRTIITKANQMGCTKAISLKASPWLEKGTWDILICHVGTMFIVDAKTGNAQLSKIQRQRGREWASAGAVPIVARSWGHVEAVLLGASTGDYEAIEK